MFPRSIYFIDEYNAFLVGLDGIVVRTFDGGLNWNTQISNTNYNLYDVTFITQNNGYIVGQVGTILHTTNGGVTFIEDEKNSNKPEQFLLQQNYPNPFNPSTNIQYAISSTQFVTLKVYDLPGREVATLVNEEKPAGIYNAEFRMDNLQFSTGVYFYRLKAGDYVETKKMLLIK